jgi:hypothetical protein
MSGSQGIISDGAGNYDNNEDCTWIIVAEDDESTPSLTFTSFLTETGYDFVTIYSCETAACFAMTQLSRLHGSVNLSTVYTSPTGVMKVHFTSDGSVTRPGFSGVWRSGGGSSSNSSSVSPVPDVPADCPDGYLLSTLGFTDEADGTAGHELTEIATSAECGERCSLLPNCEGFEYKASSGRCTLKVANRYSRESTQWPGWISCERGATDPLHAHLAVYGCAYTYV